MQLHAREHDAVRAGGEDQPTQIRTARAQGLQQRQRPATPRDPGLRPHSDHLDFDREFRSSFNDRSRDRRF